MRVRTCTLSKVACFDHVRMEFPPGGDPNRADVHLLVGNNGTGKTTVLAAMAQFFTPQDVGLAARMRGLESRIALDCGGGGPEVLALHRVEDESGGLQFDGVPLQLINQHGVLAWHAVARGKPAPPFAGVSELDSRLPAFLARTSGATF